MKISYRIGPKSVPCSTPKREKFFRRHSFIRTLWIYFSKSFQISQLKLSKGWNVICQIMIFFAYSSCLKAVADYITYLSERNPNRPLPVNIPNMVIIWAIDPRYSSSQTRSHCIVMVFLNIDLEDKMIQF